MMIQVRTTILVLFILGIFPETLYAVTVDLTVDTWDVSGTSISSGTTWNDTTLEFTSQTPSGSDYDEVEGYFDWRGSDGRFGREMFEGKLFSNLTLRLEGTEIVPPATITSTSLYDCRFA